jgi:hypothetical protein
MCTEDAMSFAKTRDRVRQSSFRFQSSKSAYIIVNTLSGCYIYMYEYRYLLFPSNYWYRQY